jgi:polyketide synthase/oxidoreductase
MRALVTGATGLVGRHLVDRLLADGWSVRALVRDPAAPDARAVAELGVELASGDVLDESSFTAAGRGCAVIFHTAAVIMARDWESYRRVNLDGTRHAIAAAADAGARLLQVSSVAVYGAATRYAAADDGTKTSEDVPLAALPPHAYYARSKRESEALVMAAHAAGRIWATAVRPDVVYGRHDRQFVPRLVRLVRARVLPLVGGGRSTMAVVHASAVADGAVRAATCDTAGGRAYNLANDFDVTVRDFFTYAARGLGLTPHFVPVPLGLARGGLRAAKRAVRIVSLGQARLGGRTALDFITRDNPFTSARARAELQWAPSVRPEVGVTDAFAWARMHRVPA